MALSYLAESEAPRDFKVSSTESEGHYKKCLLCFTVKKNFYCAECVKNGNFVHSSMPYSDRFAEKQAKLMRLKLNRQHILDRCEKLLAPRLRKDILLTDNKLSRDKLDLLRLAIEQRRSIIEAKRKELSELKNHNTELQLKLPRYQKRVASLGKHAQNQSMELQNKISTYNDQAEDLAALRRSRIRQFTKYIFPVYLSYDPSDSIEDLEFLGEESEEEPPHRPQLHIGAPWIDADGDCDHIQAWVSENKEAYTSGEARRNPAQCAAAALQLAAQLVALLAWALDLRTPHAISLRYGLARLVVVSGGVVCSDLFRSVPACRSEYSAARAWGGPVRRLRACAAALCARAGVRRLRAGAPPEPLASHGVFGGLHALALAAVADDPALGRVEPWLGRWAQCAAQWAEAWQGAEEAEGAEGEERDDPEPPEHLSWPDAHLEEEALGCSPPPAPAPAPAASLVTSAAASLASMWRGWTK